MKKIKYNKLKNRCIKAESLLNNATEEFARELQPYFNSEIDVIYQPSDGFVVLVLGSESLKTAPSNIGVDEVFNTISNNPKFYLTEY